jgi:transglutaminase-like putative cysteine protease
MGPRALPAGNMKFEISHRTVYRYRRPVAQSQHQVHLRPRRSPQQSVLHHSLLINPAPAKRTDIQDYFGNTVSLLRIEDEHSEFVVHSRSTVEIMPAAVPDLAQTAAWEAVASIALPTDGGFDPQVLQFTCASRQTPNSRAIHNFALASFPVGRPVLAGAMELTSRIFKEFKFDPSATDVSTPVARVLELKRGVCQDFAHVGIAALRSIGIPARYVSGYLLTRPPPGQPKLAGSDASHAWLSVWAPECGWVDFDPTNGIIPSGEHITVAYGRDYEDISPVSGVLLGGGDQTMSVAVDVEPQS